MTVGRRTASASTISMSRSLARSSSVSLVLPLAPQQQTSAVLYTLRRVRSSIPAADYNGVPSEFSADIIHSNNPIKGNCHNQLGLEIGSDNFFNRFERDGDLDSYCSDYTSCSSSVADFFEVLDEPLRVSKEILRSVSISYQWLDVPFYESELPACRDDSMMDFATANTAVIDEQKLAIDNVGADGRQSTDMALPTPGLPIGRQGSVRFAYIHDCRSGMSLATHVELKTAMDNLRHWAMQVPRNCCLSYRHDTSGEVATLPWPDLEAGGMDEIEEFVSTVNRIEGKPVFFPRYQRSPFEPEKNLYSQRSLTLQKGLDSQKSLTSLVGLDSQKSLISQNSLTSQKSWSSLSFALLPPLRPTLGTKK